jgi:hypothetical protein
MAPPFSPCDVRLEIRARKMKMMQKMRKQTSRRSQQRSRRMG